MKGSMDAHFYQKIRSILETARDQVYSTANPAMVQAYWEIGNNIVEQQGRSEPAEYAADQQLFLRTASFITR